MSWTLAALTAGGFALGGGAALAARAYLRPFATQGVPLLRYRLVGPPRPGSPLNELRVPLSKFEPVVRHLARRGFRAVGLDEALEGARDRAFLAGAPVALSFDGPSRTFLSEAWPLLQRYGLTRVTLFFPASRLGQRELTFGRGRAEPLLGEEDLVRLASEGVTIGLQALLPPLDEVASAERLAEERERLRALTGQPVDCLAAASPNVALLRGARRAGFRAFADVSERADGVLYRARARGPAPLILPRYDVLPTTSLLEVALVVSRRVGPTIW